jgi:hypothetical protein
MSIITITIATISGRCQPQIGGSMTAENTDQPKVLIFFLLTFYTYTWIMGRIIKVDVNRIGCLDGYCNLCSARCSERLVLCEHIYEFQDFITCIPS